MKRKIILKIRDELVSSKIYFILSLIISIYVFLPEFILFQSFRLRDIVVALISIMILLMISKISKILFIFLSITTLVISSIVLHIGLHWGTDTISSRIEVAAISPKSESLEYLMTYLSTIDIFIFLYFTIGIYFIFKLLAQTKHVYKVIKILAILFLFILLLFLNNSRYIDKIHPYCYIEPYVNIEDIEKIDKRNNFIENINNNLAIVNRKLQYDKIVIVIGESVNKNYMSAYGYDMQTTPFMNTLLKEKQSFIYDVIAPTNQTRYSIPINLTNATVNNFNLFFTSKSLITIFKEHGYKTYWLSNQGSVGKHENYISTIVAEADVEKSANLLYKDAKTDDVLINYLKQLNIDSNSKEVYFFHLMGSHFSYKERYPANSKFFENPQNIIEEYTNSIFYTDKLLSKIYDKFSHSKLLFIYFSDHGEVVGMKKHGHGFSPAYQDEYNIPLFVYSSENNQRLINLRNLNKKSIFNMESFNNFIKYVLGIDTNVSNISQSSSVFTLDPKNIIDYNTLIPYKDN